MGADDYLVKPVHLGKLNARGNTLLRRRFLGDGDRVVFQDLQIDMLKNITVVANQEIQLTKTEQDILYLLMISNERVVSKEEIAKHITGQSDISFYNFDVLYAPVKNLKKKLLSAGKYIKTVYSIGYKIAV